MMTSIADALRGLTEEQKLEAVTAFAAHTIIEAGIAPHDHQAFTKTFMSGAKRAGDAMSVIMKAIKDGIISDGDITRVAMEVVLGGAGAGAGAAAAAGVGGPAPAHDAGSAGHAAPRQDPQRVLKVVRDQVASGKRVTRAALLDSTIANLLSASEDRPAMCYTCRDEYTDPRDLVTCTCTVANGVVRCWSCDMGRHLHVRCNARGRRCRVWPRPADDGTPHTDTVVVSLSHDMFLDRDAAAADGSNGIVTRVLPLALAPTWQCPECDGFVFIAADWAQKETMRVYAADGTGSYEVGRVTHVSCNRGGEGCHGDGDRPVHALATMDFAASVVPLTDPMTARTAVERGVVERFLREKAASHSAVTAGDVMRAHPGADGARMPIATSRVLLRSLHAFASTSLLALTSCTTPCVVCRYNARRIWLDGNFKVFRRLTESRVDANIKLPLSVVVDDAEVKDVLQDLAASSAGRAEGKMCGPTEWTAAADSKRAAPSLDISGMMMAVCMHGAVYAAFPMHGGEQYMYHAYGLALGHAAGAGTFLVDIWCHLQRHFNRISERNPSWAESMFHKLFGGRNVSATVRITAPQVVKGGGQTLVITHRLDERKATPPDSYSRKYGPAAAAAAAAAAGAGFADWQAGMVAEDAARPPITGIELLRMRGHGRESGTVNGAIPAMHAAGHCQRCQLIHGGPCVKEAGAGNEVIEQTNAEVSAEASLLHNASPLGYKLQTASNFSAINARYNDAAAERVGRGIISAVQNMAVASGVYRGALVGQALPEFPVCADGNGHDAYAYYTSSGGGGITHVPVQPPASFPPGVPYNPQAELFERRLAVRAGDHKAQGVSPAAKAAKLRDRYMALITLKAEVDALVEHAHTVADAADLDASRTDFAFALLHATTEARRFLQKHKAADAPAAAAASMKLADAIAAAKVALSKDPAARASADARIVIMFADLREVAMRLAGAVQEMHSTGAAYPAAANSAAARTSLRKLRDGVERQRSQLADALALSTDAHVRVWQVPSLAQLADPDILPAKIGNLVLVEAELILPAWVKSYQKLRACGAELHLHIDPLDGAIQALGARIGELHVQISAAQAVPPNLVAASGYSAMVRDGPARDPITSTTLQEEIILFQVAVGELTAAQQRTAAVTLAAAAWEGIRTLERLRDKLRRLKAGAEALMLRLNTILDTGLRVDSQSRAFLSRRLRHLLSGALTADAWAAHGVNAPVSAGGAATAAEGTAAGDSGDDTADDSDDDGGGSDGDSVGRRDGAADLFREVVDELDAGDAGADGPAMAGDDDGVPAVGGHGAALDLQHLAGLAASRMDVDGDDGAGDL
jgi:hypothetical protein